LTDAEVLASCGSSAGASSPVVFLHVRRVRGGPANGKRARECLDFWKKSGELFTTPAGSNDDWYWLYAAVASGDDAFLVSNDEMRDHAFQMLPAPALFKKWKERHQVRFHMSKGADGLELYFPPPFSHCAQSDVDEKWWMIPKDDGTWLCAVKCEDEIE
jgi:proteinaceous RNase P